MSEKLDPEAKRLRNVSSGELADAIGALEARVEVLKAEAIRRELRRVEGEAARRIRSPLRRLCLPFGREAGEGLRASPFRIGDFPAQASLRAPFRGHFVIEQPDGMRALDDRSLGSATYNNRDATPYARGAVRAPRRD
jgi:hypothetical protein